MKIKHLWMDNRFFNWLFESEAIIGWWGFGLFAGGIGLPFAFMAVSDGWVVPVFGTIATTVAFELAPLVILFSPIEQLDNESYRPGGKAVGRYDYRGDAVRGSRDLMKEIIRLPKDDQKRFPTGLYETLRKNIEPKARYEINKELADTLDEIAKRNEALAIAARKAIPTEHIVEILKDTRAHFKIETDTIKELM